MSVTAVFVSTVHVVSSVYHMRVRVRVNFTLFARDHMNCCEKSASREGMRVTVSVGCVSVRVSMRATVSEGVCAGMR